MAPLTLHNTTCTAQLRGTHFLWHDTRARSRQIFMLQVTHARKKYLEMLLAGAYCRSDRFGRIYRPSEQCEIRCRASICSIHCKIRCRTHLERTAHDRCCAQTSGQRSCTDIQACSHVEAAACQSRAASTTQHSTAQHSNQPCAREKTRFGWWSLSFRFLPSKPCFPLPAAQNRPQAIHGCSKRG